MTPSHSAIGVSAAQSRVAAPARVSRAASSAAQSDTSPGLLSGSGTTPSLAQASSVARTTLGANAAATPKRTIAIPRVVSLPSFMT